MFYKFNNMLGRITPGTQSEVYSPQGFTPYSREPSQIIFDQKKTQPALEPAVSMTSARPASTTAVKEALGIVPNNTRYKQIMQIQNLFLKEDGKLVWQKMGGRDRAGYLFTVALCFVGCAFLVPQLYKMSVPSANKD